MSNKHSSDDNKNNKDNGVERKFDDYVFVEDFEFEDVYSDSQKAPKPAGTSGKRHKEKKKKKKRHILLKLTAVLLVLVLTAGGAGLYSVNKLLNNIEYQTEDKHVNKYIDSGKLLSDKDIKNILLMGVDSRNERTDSRSDTMMIVSVNAKKKEIILTSFMRDLYVETPKNGHNRLNSANVFGGPGLLMDTIEYNFKIDIDNYMLVTFDAFRKLVDGIGGIYVDISEAEAKYMHGSFVNLPHIKAGESVHLNGKEALWYSRIRKLDSDFHRTNRQREVVKSIIAQTMKTSPIKLYSVAADMMSLIKTDLTKEEILSFSSLIPAFYSGYEIKSLTVPADNTWYYANRYGMSVIVADEKKNADFLEENIYRNDKDE
ncbi:MAG: LCP family protein [Clostridiales bacterium]|jgi:LCP family protein required for cell wall assembly|nr:LCP family protein [Clostridiales bacterium]